METQFTNESLEKINRICEVTNGCGMQPGTFGLLENELSFLAERLAVSQLQAFFFAVIFQLELDGEGTCLKSLGKFLDYKGILLLNYTSEWTSLEEKNLIEINRSGAFGRGRKEDFGIHPTVKAAIVRDELPLPAPEKSENGIVEFLETFYKQACSCDEGEICTYELYSNVRRLLKKNEKIAFVQEIKHLELEYREKCLLLYLSWKSISGMESVSLSRSIEGLIDDEVRRIHFTQSLIKGINPLIKLDLVEVVKGDFLNSSELKLTDKALELLEKEGLELNFAGEEKDLLKPEKIVEKELFFGREELQQLEMLENSLEETRLINIRNQLEKNKLPRGITVILHGLPGTGKTESVYQLARKSRRSILKVEISEAKSKWFGDSEKLIKKIFTRYKSAAKKQDRLPILLFNEADAILSKRRDTGSSVSQTENAIQNILLEELENFDGIFIATTNLVNNLDKAFERRFLFKIEFDQPGEEVKQKIWKSRLDFLPSEACLKLARDYNLSGGQIENISRKIMMQEVINGSKPSLEEIISFCNAEQFQRQTGKIGFGLSRP
ncbi:MAG: ATP-binding protein [Bacteroidota bacterium]